MAYKYYNPVPDGKEHGDCVIRAISKVMDYSWEQTYLELCIAGYLKHDWGSANYVWDSYLRDCGFVRRVIPNTCPDCYTVRDFCEDYSYGEYIVATGDHIIAVIDGDYYDSWDSGNEVPIYYYKRQI